MYPLPTEKGKWKSLRGDVNVALGRDIMLEIVLNVLMPPKTSCGEYGKHLTGCMQSGHLEKGCHLDDECTTPRGEVNVVLGSEPLFCHSVEVQNK